MAAGTITATDIAQAIFDLPAGGGAVKVTGVSEGAEVREVTIDAQGNLVLNIG